MNKFLLRNLKNERRRIEKELNKIDKDIHRAENTNVVMEGSMELKTLVDIDKTEVMFINKNIDFGIKLKMKVERFENEITCTLTTDDKKFDKPMSFTGVAKCKKGETFNLAIGITIAQNRAIREIYNFIIGLFV